MECSNNFVFVGAEIKTGKSSIRSKLTKKKVSCPYSDDVGVASLGAVCLAALCLQCIVSTRTLHCTPNQLNISERDVTCNM